MRRTPPVPSGLIDVHTHGIASALPDLSAHPGRWPTVEQLAVVVWGDDQYETFREEVVPAFCVMAYEDMDIRPFAGPLAAGDAVRFTATGGQQVTATAPAELLVWEMHATGGGW